MSAKPGKILIVDDEIKNRTLLSTYLDAEGYQHQDASDGKQALEIVKNYQPDLILMDIMMPVMNGFETVRKLKEDLETKCIPIIMFTALDDRESRIRALDAGAEEYLTKPVDRVDLKIRIRNLLRLKEFSDFLVNHNQTLEQQVQERTQALKDSFVETIYTLMRAAEYRDDETGVHVKRISFYTKNWLKNLVWIKRFARPSFMQVPCMMSASLASLIASC